ncbi:hypothetical protein ACP4OV_013964 [Aristida adscensionis]
MQPMATTKRYTYGTSCSASIKQGLWSSRSTTSGYSKALIVRSSEIPAGQDVNSGGPMHELESSMEAKDNLDSLVANSIGRLIFEAGLEPNFVLLPSYRGIIDLLTHGVQIEMPSYDFILQMQLRDVEQHERALREHWEISGCTVILDSWKSQCGKCFMSVLVHCSKGMLFLKSMDISTIIADVDELASMLCSVVEYIGVRNIVQVITNDASPHMQAAEHAVLKKHNQSFFFTLCADHCIDLLLKQIAADDHVKEVLMKASRITRFIYGHEQAMGLKALYIGSGEIISNSNLKYVAMFKTLERLVIEKENLMEMFRSRDACDDLSSASLFGHIRELIQTDEAFWCAASLIVRLTHPLFSFLDKLKHDNCPVGVLYDAMDWAKEEIKQNLGHEHDKYWVMIDHIWDNYLHSPVHAAGYFFNPRIFYTDKYCHDDEISSGVTACILRIASSHHDALLVADQMEVYQRKSGLFGSNLAIQEAKGTPQVLWWSRHGGSTPQLQSFVMRILNQPCVGAGRYNMDKGVSERLHMGTRSSLDQERFRNMEYIHYNLHLASSVPSVDGPAFAERGKLTSKLVDWTIAEDAAGPLAIDG